MNIFDRKRTHHFDVIPGAVRPGRSIPMRLVAAAVFVLAAAITAPFSYTAWQALANTTTLTPVTCQGDWETGESRYVAVATAGDQKLFCSFSAFPADTAVPVAAASLIITFAQEEHTSEAASALESLPETQAQPDTEESEEIPAAPTESSSDTPPVESLPESFPAPVLESSAPEESVSEEPLSEEPASDPESVSEPVLEPAPVSEPEPEDSTSETEEPASEEVAPETEEEPTPEPEPAAWQFGAQRAHAQEILEETPEPLAEESTQEPEHASPEGSEVAVSYTTDGVIWTELGTHIARPGGERGFSLELGDTDAIQTLVVRLVATSVTDAEPIYLSNVQLVVRTDPEALEEPLVLEPEVAVPEPYQYRREFAVDPEATHACAPVPSTIDITRQESARFFLSLEHGASAGRELLELGSMPYGIDMRFAASGGHALDRVEGREEVEVQVTVFPGAQVGSMSIPIIYIQHHDGEQSFVTCQVNVISQPL